MKLLHTIFLLLAGLSVIGSANAQSQIAGVASVTDGDTLVIHGNRIRLHGIDAPEIGQFCEKDGERYRCGQQAALALAEKIGRSTIRCDRRDVDRYKRIVAVCWLGQEDLNGWMVRQGWAIAYRRYSLDYIEVEGQPKNAEIGIWAGSFIEPSKWRRGERLGLSDASSSPGCQIKGNINRNGERIYHVPGGRYHEQTRIDESRGERWFCSEGDAERAGWRRSRQ